MGLFGGDFTAVALFIGVATGLASFWLGRRLSRRWGQKREEKERAQRLTQETRQQRRARERREAGRRG